jgi:prepilin-type processing-associated H-X9-DG protein
VGINLDSSATLMESNGPPYTLHFAGLNILYADGQVRGYTTRSDGPPTHSYVIDFKQDTSFPRGPAQVIDDWSSVTARMALQRMNWVEFRLAFVSPKAEIVSGFAELTINATHKKRFSIPRQICASNGTFYATNSP